MKTVALFVALLLVGCAGKFLAPSSSEQRATDHPQGTAVGASFPGVNQGTQTTTATRSTDT